MHRERLEERRLGAGRADGGIALKRRARALPFVALAATLFLSSRPAPAAAQSTDEYWRTLSAERQPTVVLASAAPASVPEPLAEALRLFRVYEMTADEGAARRARELLRRTEVAEEHRAWHALAMAMVLARGPDSRMRDLGDGDDWYVDPNSLGSARSLRLLRAALEIDPPLRAAALELATWALDRAHPAVAAEAEVTLAAFPPDADVLVARAALNQLLGDFRRAALYADGAERAGADVALARHARAYALLQDPLTAAAGVEAYHDGLRAMTPDARAEYGRMIEPILTDDEHDEWRGLSIGASGAWLERFWRRSAARAGVTPDERLTEHYRRLHGARVDHPAASPLSVMQIQARFVIREDSRRFGLSLRGLMLVRHGDPFRLSHLEDCLADPWIRTGTGVICPGGADRLGIFQRAATLAAGDNFDPFARPLAFAYGLYAFRGAADRTDLVFAVALPARSANALVEGTGELAGLLSAILLPDSGDVVRRDTMFREPLPARLDPVAGETDALALLHASVAVPTGESSLEYRITVSDVARHAGGRAGGRLEVPDLGGFALSDLVIAPVDARGTWRRGGVTVALAPRRSFARDESFRLYYEVYGLGEDTPYRTEIELVPAAEGLRARLRGLLGRGDSVRLRFDGRAPVPDVVFGVQELRTVDLDDLESGVWMLRVVVTDLTSGRTAVRETVVEVAATP